MSIVRRGLRAGLVVVALGGAGISAFLLAASTNASAARLLARGCGGGQRVNCTGVLASDWAQIGFLPTAAWGLIYFLIAALWYAVAGLPNRRGRHWHLVPLTATGVGAAVSAVLLGVMAFRLGTWCPWCAAAHGLNGLLLVGTLLAWPRHDVARAPGALPEAARPSGRAVATVAALGVSWGVAAVAVMSAGYYYSAAGTARGAYLEATNNAGYLAWRHRAGRPFEILVRADDPAIGPAAAPHTLVAFIDFDCPHCRELDAFAPRLVERQRGRLRYVLKHYPMSAACSDQLPAAHDRHPFACEAARAFEAVRACGSAEAVERFRARLVASGASAARGDFRAWAEQLSIPSDCVMRALNDAAVKARIAEDVALARRLDIDGSGACFLDGRRLPSWRITTTDAAARTDEVQTLRLWDRLLAEDAPR
ncbi:MAG: vitamin K epoxide reductase family protein [Phycisphaerae bacterium]